LHHYVFKIKFKSGYLGRVKELKRERLDQVNDGKGRSVVPLSRDKEIFMSRCPFVPGQGQEQMSGDKLLCPGISWDKITFPKEHKKQEQVVLKQERMF
jgi:hypothetical protein